MAFSRELTRRLTIEDEPLTKRLKLAENAFTSEDLPLNRKEDIVIKWLCEAAAAENNENLVLNTLSRCLTFKNIPNGSMLKSEVKKVLIETLRAKLKFTDAHGIEETLNCCRTTFSCQEIQLYFQSEFLAFFELIKALCQLALQGDSAPEIVVRKEDARKCVISALECLASCYKQTAKKDEFLDAFVCQILYPLCDLVEKNENDKLGAEIHKSIQHLFFGKSRYAQFKNNGESDGDFSTKLFAELRKLASSHGETSTAIVFLRIFRAAVGSYKSDPSTIDAIFRNLIEAALSAKLRVLASFRESMTNVTFDYQNKIGDASLFEYLQKIIDEIVAREQLDSSCYDALASIAVLNPLIIETKMESVLGRILLEKKDDETIKSYRDLMIILVNSGIRLRREQKIVSWIFTALEDKRLEDNRDHLEIQSTFPKEFKEQFSKAVGNMTSMQTIGVFRTLNFHLNKFVQTDIKDKDIANFMLQANVELMSAYFEGARIFDNSVPKSAQEKFIQGLKDLGATISTLINKLLKMKRNEKMIVPLLTVAWYWDKMYSTMGYYAPDSVSEKLSFPISELQMHQIAENVNTTECKRAMNRIIGERIGQNLTDEGSLELETLKDDLENSWPVIIDENPQILSLMTNSQIADLARFFIDDLKSSNFEREESVKRLSYRYIQNDERLVKALVLQLLADISSFVNQSTTKVIAGHINVVKILDRGKASKALKLMGEELIKNDWASINEKAIMELSKNMKILTHLPLIYLSTDIRTIILLVAYSIKKECPDDKLISELCRDAILDASEKSDIDIINYITADSLIDELMSDKSVQRAIESSLKNVTSWETLKHLVKRSQSSSESAAVFLECLERVRGKVKNEQKEVFKKAERKLSKKLLDGIASELKDHADVKRLTIALKVHLTDGELSEHLVEVTMATIRQIFVTEGPKDDKLVAEGLRLANVLLKHRGKFNMNEEIVNSIWQHILKNPIKEIVLPLVETTEPKVLGKLLSSLHAQMISGLKESNENDLAKALTILASILSVRMGGNRHKVRITALHNLLQAVQVSKFPENLWPAILKFVHSLLSDELHVAERSIDVILLLVGRSLKEAELLACEKVLQILSSLVKFHSGIITDRLPILLGFYRQLVRIVVQESRKVTTEDQNLRCLALDIEKFTNVLVKLKKDVARISPYVIADLVEIFSEGVVPSYVKRPLEDSVGHFLSISDHHAISFLSRTLPTATQGIFKTLYETYNKFYKFTGKI